MEGSVGVADSNCDSDKHVKCPKCSTTTEKHVPQPTIDEKHKQKKRKYWKESTNFPMQEEIYPGK